MITFLKKQWHRLKLRRDERRIHQWRRQWRPALWAQFIDLGYVVVPHAAMQKHMAVIVLPKFKKVVYHPLLSRHQRHLACAVALMGMTRLRAERKFAAHYALPLSDISFPDGPEDNVKWKDWLAALEYLAPLTYVDHLKRHYPIDVTRYLQRVFDLPPEAAAQRLVEHRLWSESKHATLLSPSPLSTDP